MYRAIQRINHYPADKYYGNQSELVTVLPLYNNFIVSVKGITVVLRMVFSLFRLCCKIPDVLHEIDNPHLSNDDILRDVLDGEYVQNHPIFAMHKNALIF